MPKLFIGLGNPGNDYAPTRHNAGFWLLDAVAQRLQITFSRQKKFNADVASAAGMHLIKPQTWMNNSGAAAQAAAAFYGVAVEEILVAHDEIDLSAGTLRLKFGGGTAGHNGLSDICQKLGERNFWRLRLGVGRAGGVDMSNYVLRPPAKDDAIAISAAFERFFTVWDDILANDYQNAMRVLHTTEGQE